MKIGLYGDSWAWDWSVWSPGGRRELLLRNTPEGEPQRKRLSLPTRKETDPSEFVEALKSYGHDVTNYCKPGTCLHTSKTILLGTHEQYDCVVVFATCPYRILANARVERLEDKWISEWSVFNYHRRLDIKFRDYTPQQHEEWYEQTQLEWQQALPQGKTIVLGGAGPIKNLIHPGINHVKKHLSSLDDYNSGYHSQCYSWVKATVNKDWNRDTIAMIADHVEAIESGSVGDPYHLITPELEALAHSVNSLINTHVHPKT